MWCLMGKSGYRAGRGVAAAVLAGLGVAAPAGAVWAAPEATHAAGSWGKAIGVPGLAALNKGEYAEVRAVSCVSPGYCAAGGDYADRHGHSQGFVAVERNGRWGKAIGVPGLGALNAGGFAEVVSVSCSSPGSCAAGGDYSNGPRGVDVREFVVSERNGRWGQATQIRGPGGLNGGADAEPMSLSCGSAGDCAAGGEYVDGSGNYQGFAAVERNGVWGKAVEVPGLGALNAGGFAEIDAVSCAPAGSCAAGGFYTNRRLQQGFVVTERNGRWGKATGVPGLGALNAGATADMDGADVSSVSCASAGNCAAGGFYTARHRRNEGFVAVERNGRWGKATAVPGLAALNTGGSAAVYSVSCASPGSCAAGGRYTASHRRQQGFLVVERNGRWGKAAGVPGLGSLTKGAVAEVDGVSCASAGNCAAGGSYQDAPYEDQGFVVSERNGRWGKATPIPGLQALNTAGDAQVYSVSCGPAGNCAAGGSYTEGLVTLQGFVVSRSG